MATPLPPFRLVPEWFMKMGNCAMMMFWLPVALGETLLANAFASRLSAPSAIAAWIFATLAWAIAFFHAVLCFREWRRRHRQS
ncbi:MAG: hypothetical protein M0T84_12150 [Betaproteobacteria bacterium]|nr:hypothetical protein [Betaproteobacteria bacterium]